MLDGTLLESFYHSVEACRRIHWRVLTDLEIGRTLRRLAGEISVAPSGPAADPEDVGLLAFHPGTLRGGRRDLRRVLSLAVAVVIEASATRYERSDITESLLDLAEFYDPLVRFSLPLVQADPAGGYFVVE